MFRQSQKTTNCHYFGTMREENVLSVPKSLQIAVFWDYTRNIRPESSKAKAGRDKVISCSGLE